MQTTLNEQKKESAQIVPDTGVFAAVSISDISTALLLANGVECSSFTAGGSKDSLTV